jgi:hypothetical protein
MRFKNEDGTYWEDPKSALREFDPVENNIDAKIFEKIVDPNRRNHYPSQRFSGITEVDGDSDSDIDRYGTFKSVPDM